MIFWLAVFVAGFIIGMTPVVLVMVYLHRHHTVTHQSSAYRCLNCGKVARPHAGSPDIHVTGGANYCGELATRRPLR